LLTPVLRDSRRIPGVNLYHSLQGAVIDVGFADGDADALVALWQESLARALAAAGWRGNEARVRRFPGGASLFFTAPIDGLYAATEVNEWAWADAVARHGGRAALPLEEASARLRGFIEREREPSLVALRDAAAKRNVSFHLDHKAVSVGSGVGAEVHPVADPHHPVAPAPESVAWERVYDVPSVLVTGSNGKTTTVRLLAAVVRAWGRVPGYNTTDNIVVGDEILDTGDWSGPMGSRTVLRNPRVEAAVLETARGGILRRGLALRRASAAIVTNVAEDHFGEWGIHDVRGIAEAKLVVGRVVPRLIVNADDRVLVGVLEEQRARGLIAADVGYFTLDAGNAVVREHLSRGGTAALLDDGMMAFLHGRRRWDVVPAAGLPITFGGAARFNIANALGALLVAAAIGVPRDAIVTGLAGFQGSPRENPGRSHLFEVDGARVLVDFAHNPHGMRALVEAASAMPARRRIVVLGQAGDRDDESIRSLARETWTWRPDRVILKEMERYLRGRQPGEATSLIREEFIRLGASPRIFTQAPSEYAAVELALAEARPGDLVLLPVHAERERVLALMEARSNGPGSDGTG
jgi:cyanophycin synthetase